MSAAAETARALRCHDGAVRSGNCVFSSSASNGASPLTFSPESSLRVSLEESSALLSFSLSLDSSQPPCMPPSLQGRVVAIARLCRRDHVLLRENGQDLRSQTGQKHALGVRERDADDRQIHVQMRWCERLGGARVFGECPANVVVRRGKPVAPLQTQDDIDVIEDVAMRAGADRGGCGQVGPARRAHASPDSEARVGDAYHHRLAHYSAYNHGIRISTHVGHDHASTLDAGACTFCPRLTTDAETLSASGSHRIFKAVCQLDVRELEQ
eukprot:scaffold544_cov117-Isochrysis_galbana.AAC.13